MDSTELEIILINIVIIVAAYLFFHPKDAGLKLKKMLVSDLAILAFSLCCVGSMYYQSEIQLNALVASLNWFWFTVITYVLIDIPVLLWHLQKYKAKPVTDI